MARDRDTETLIRQNIELAEKLARARYDLYIAKRACNMLIASIALIGLIFLVMVMRYA